MIFVSYSERDRELIEALVVDLGVLGHNVFFDNKTRGSMLRWTEIFENIERATTFVYTLTPNTLASYARMLEYEHALALGKKIVAIRFGEIDLWQLPPGMPEILEYQAHHALVRAELARRIQSSSDTASETTFTARPDLSFALAQLFRRINTPNKSAAEQAAILLNLQDFLQRRETYIAAEGMLNDFAAQLASSDPLLSEIHRVRTRLKRSPTSNILRARRLIMAGALAVVIVAAIALLIRGISMRRTSGNPVVSTETLPPPTATTRPTMSQIDEGSLGTLESTTDPMAFPSATEQRVSPSPTRPQSITLYEDFFMATRFTTKSREARRATKAKAVALLARKPPVIRQ